MNLITETSAVPFEEDSLESSTNSIVKADPSKKKIQDSDDSKKKVSNVTIINVGFGDASKSEPNQSQPVDSQHQTDETESPVVTVTVGIPEESTTLESKTLSDDKPEQVNQEGNDDVKPSAVDVSSGDEARTSLPEASAPEPSKLESDVHAQVLETAEKVLDVLPGIIEQLVSVDKLLPAETEEIQLGVQQQEDDTIRSGKVLKRMMKHSGSLPFILGENVPESSDENDKTSADAPLDTGELLLRC